LGGWRPPLGLHTPAPHLHLHAAVQHGPALNADVPTAPFAPSLNLQPLPAGSVWTGCWGTCGVGRRAGPFLRATSTVHWWAEVDTEMGAARARLLPARNAYPGAMLGCDLASWLDRSHEKV
jgi:hypothetical protein